MNKFGERRCIVHKKFHPTMSVEKMAAWLDGNLPVSAMSEMVAQIQRDPMLEEVVAMSDAIDCDMDTFEASGESLPDELLDNDFNLPNPDQRTGFLRDHLLGQVCCASIAPSAAMCDFDVAADAAPPAEDDDDEKSLFDKIKDLFKDEEDDE
ncbi:MAG: hypothetical protein J6X51_04205 [Bacteroidales bacterium]|nr:hypothetical protein [Bacteroidales bacterium]